MIEKLSDNPNPEALSWLLEMELVSSPYVLNSLILNMIVPIKGIKDVQLVIDEKRKKILIYLELRWWEKRFHAKKIEQQINDIIEQTLPSFKKRVIFDKVLLEKAVKIANG